jgi:hypothetical protein
MTLHLTLNSTHGFIWTILIYWIHKLREKSNFLGFAINISLVGTLFEVFRYETK